MSNTNLNTDLKTLPLSLKDSLTTPNPLAYIKNALAKSSVGIETLKLTGARAPTDERFFCTRFMVGCVGQSSDWRFPVSRSLNPVQSATPLRLRPLGGSNLTITGGI